jgi:OmpA-OmpF porin, OOP family
VQGTPTANNDAVHDWSGPRTLGEARVQALVPGATQEASTPGPPAEALEDDSFFGERRRTRYAWPMRSSLIGVLALAGSTVCRLSFAQAAIDLYQFEPPPAPDGTLYLEPTTTPAAGAWNVGVVGSYGYRLITAKSDTGERLPAPLQHRVATDYVASIGLGRSMALGWVLPSVLYQTGHDWSQFGLPAPTQTALGDARLSLKATLLAPDPMGGVGLAALGAVSVPTGNGMAYVSDESSSADLRLLGELNVLVGHLRASAGMHLRSRERTFAGERYGDSASWGLGVGVLPQALGLTQDGGWLATAELRGRVGVTPAFATSAQSFTVLGLSARFQVGDLSLLAGCELPIAASVGTPLVRGVFGVGWAPRIPDQDQDGIPDDVDQCVDLPEDADQFQDSDGCPDFDNDDDGSPDPDDRCALEREDQDGFQDEDGCIDPDNDADGVPDIADGCPDQRGPRSLDPKLNGCPESKPEEKPEAPAAEQPESLPETDAPPQTDTPPAPPSNAPTTGTPPPSSSPPPVPSPDTSADGPAGAGTQPEDRP